VRLKNTVPLVLKQLQPLGFGSTTFEALQGQQAGAFRFEALQVAAADDDADGFGDDMTNGYRRLCYYFGCVLDRDS
jgi:hypothetical protein